MAVPLELSAHGIGLCGDCRMSERIVNRRGSTFWRCKRSDSDPRYPRYPRLPVLRCAGHVSRGATIEEAEGDPEKR